MSSAVFAGPPPTSPPPAAIQSYLAATGRQRAYAFEMQRLSPQNAVLETVQVLYACPNRLYVTSRIPGKPDATLACDGKTLWWWNDRQQMRRDAPPDLTQLNPPRANRNVSLPLTFTMNVALRLFGDPAQLTKLSNLADAGKVELNGKTARKVVSFDGECRRTFWFDEATGLPLKLTSQEDEKLYTFVIHSVSYDPQAEVRFARKPPAGRESYREEPPLPPPPLPALKTVAPDFTLPALKGPATTLASTKGRVTLLAFLVSTYHACRQLAPDLQKLHEEFGSKGLGVLSLYTEPQTEGRVRLEKFLTTHPQLTMPALLDLDDGKVPTVASRYRVSSCPAVFLLDKEGKIAALFVGWSPQRAQEIRDALARLGVK